MGNHRSRRRSERPRLTIRQVLKWADAHHRRTGVWPGQWSGPVVGARSEKWPNINANLRHGGRGLPRGSSLAKLLAEQRGVRNPKGLPPYSLKQILQWADAHHRRTGQWPNRMAGLIHDAPGETWTAVEIALYHGRRGLPGGSTLARLLAAERGIRNRRLPPRLSIQQVLAWADAHRVTTGQWPRAQSGPVHGHPGETWANLNSALHNGLRGLPSGSSILRLLQRYRGARSRWRPPHLTISRILEYADAHFRRTGAWPRPNSGEIAGTCGDTWQSVNTALWNGHRGLSGGSSLPRLLAERRGVRNVNAPPRLTIAQILAWADAHRQRSGAWPRVKRQPLVEAPGETWTAINAALILGLRGLPGGISLANLLSAERGVRNRLAPPRLTRRLVRTWAAAHYRRTGRWPRRTSGAVHGAVGETWNAIGLALARGRRGVGPGWSLAALFP